MESIKQTQEMEVAIHVLQVIQQTALPAPMVRLAKRLVCPDTIRKTEHVRNAITENIKQPSEPVNAPHAARAGRQRIKVPPHLRLVSARKIVIKTATLARNVRRDRLRRPDQPRFHNVLAVPATQK